VNIRQRLIRIARESEQTTPDYWDRDCRCCMAVREPEDLFGRRQIKGRVQVITIRGEEIHAWHTEEQIIAFMEHNDKQVAELRAFRERHPRG
jgi:hypothetical protein